MTFPSSPPAFIDPQQSVDELLRSHPESLSALNTLGIDLCCGGVLSLADAARANGLDLDAMLDAIRAAIGPR
jgi:iron-sulfur cluster repair protein YtfE (RIC family)